MTRMARQTLAWMVLVGLTAVPARLGAEPAPDLDGTYLAQGANPDGSPYRGFVHITRRGDSFLVSWSFPESRGGVAVLALSSVGYGILSGHTLAVSYYGADSAGIIVYEIEGDGARLSGRWTVAGDAGTVYAETLTRLPARASAPSSSGPTAEEPKKVEPPAPEPPVVEPPRRQAPPVQRPTNRSTRALEL
jgi:hypothetical protein